jgi:hypothetical protein
MTWNIAKSYNFSNALELFLELSDFINVLESCIYFGILQMCQSYYLFWKSKKIRSRKFFILFGSNLSKLNTDRSIHDLNSKNPKNLNANSVKNLKQEEKKSFSYIFRFCQIINIFVCPMLNHNNTNI